MLGWLVCFFHILFFSLLFSFAFVARCVYTFVFIVFLLHFQFPFSLLIFKRLEKLKWRAHFIEDVVQLFCCCCCCWNFILSHNYLYPLGGVVIWNFFFRNLLDVYRFRKFEKKKKWISRCEKPKVQAENFYFFPSNNSCDLSGSFLSKFKRNKSFSSTLPKQAIIEPRRKCFDKKFLFFPHRFFYLKQPSFCFFFLNCQTK